jgi:hypothetical protein
MIDFELAEPRPVLVLRRREKADADLFVRVRQVKDRLSDEPHPRARQSTVKSCGHPTSPPDLMQ